MPIEHIVGKIPDRTIVALIDDVESRFGIHSKGYHIGEVGFNAVPDNLLKSTPTYALTEAVVDTKDRKFHLRITRNYNGQPHFDLIRIEARPNYQPSANDMLVLDDVIRARVKFPAYSALEKSDGRVVSLLEKEMASIASMHEKLMADALELRQKYETEHEERRSLLEKEQMEFRQKLQDEEQKSLELINSRKSELEEKLQEFDLSDHMRARRKQREEITLQVQRVLNEPKATTDSFSKLMMILGICFLGFAGSGWLAIESFEAFIAKAQNVPIPLETSIGATPEASAALPADTGDDRSATPSIPNSVQLAQPSGGNDYLMWILAIRAILLAGVAIGFLIYLLTFIRRSHDEDIRYHRDLQRYGMDINRASWVIETAMEMTTKENATLPERWIEGACAGLFQTGASKAGEVNSLSALGAVLGLGPEIEAGTEGIKMRLSGRAAKAAAKETEAAANGG